MRQKQIKEARTFEAGKYNSTTDWFSSTRNAGILCICTSEMQRFWRINYVPKVEVVLTNWNVKESVEVVPTEYLADFDGKRITITPSQHSAIERFIDAHGKCFMYVNVVSKNGKRRKVVKKI